MRFLIKIIVLLCFCYPLMGCESLPGIPTTLQETPPTHNEEAFKAAVQSAIFQSGEFETANIEVMTDRGVVTLTGVVKTIRQYDLAVKIVSEMNGVKGVHNHLVIRK
jgi:hyperosmotically inducible periplasmic protein